MWNEKIDDIDEMTELCSIMNRNGSDKGSGHHNYTKLYYKLFKDIRDEPLNILEIGIGSINSTIPSNMAGDNPNKITYKPGGSIRGWLEFFPQSTIYAGDIDRSIIEFQNPRVHGLFLDQTSDERFTSLLNGYFKDIMFDIIIDDGLHYFPVNCQTLKHLCYKR